LQMEGKICNRKPRGLLLNHSLMPFCNSSGKKTDKTPTIAGI